MADQGASKEQHSSTGDQLTVPADLDPLLLRDGLFNLPLVRRDRSLALLADALGKAHETQSILQQPTRLDESIHESPRNQSINQSIIQSIDQSTIQLIEPIAPLRTLASAGRSSICCSAVSAAAAPQLQPFPPSSECACFSSPGFRSRIVSYWQGTVSGEDDATHISLAYQRVEVAPHRVEAEG